MLASVWMLLASGPLLANEAPVVRVTFFFTPACRQCAETRAAVRRAEARFGGRIRVERVDMSRPGTRAAQRLFQRLDACGYDKLVTPDLCVFVGDACLAGPERILGGLETAVARALAGRGRVRAPARVDRWGFWALSAAALVDGVNPCAFATVVLLVSMLAAAGRHRRQMLVAGASFTAAVYATYFLLGLCFYGALHGLAGFLYLSDLVYLLAFGLCVACGALSLWDAVGIWRGGRPQDMLLKVPEPLRDRMRKRIRAGVHARALAGGAFAAGVGVSLLESVCTGQVYVPALAGLARSETAWSRGVLLLAWYNLLFVLPLVVVFATAFAGVKSDRLAAFGRQHAGMAKLLLAVVFVAMAGWMWPALVWPPGVR